jgi:hypothetical protein
MRPARRWKCRVCQRRWLCWVVGMLMPCPSWMPEGDTMSPVSMVGEAPVSKVGKSRGLMLKFCPSTVRGGIISKLSKLPIRLTRTRFAPGTAAKEIVPDGARACPVLMTLPPMRVMSCSCRTAKFPALIIVPGWALSKAKRLGVPF